MAYHDVALLRQDVDFTLRTMACYATETLSDPEQEDPNVWAVHNSWDMAAQPGFADAYAYAIATGNTEPGRDPSVITDAQILSAVQSLLSKP